MGILCEDASREDIATGLLIVTTSVSTEKAWWKNGNFQRIEVLIHVLRKLCYPLTIPKTV